MFTNKNGLTYQVNEYGWPYYLDDAGSITYLPFDGENGEGAKYYIDFDGNQYYPNYGTLDLKHPELGLQHTVLFKKFSNSIMLKNNILYPYNASGIPIVYDANKGVFNELPAKILDTDGKKYYELRGGQLWCADTKTIVDSSSVTLAGGAPVVGGGAPVVGGGAPVVGGGAPVVGGGAPVVGGGAPVVGGGAPVVGGGAPVVGGGAPVVGGGAPVVGGGAPAPASPSKLKRFFSKFSPIDASGAPGISGIPNLEPEHGTHTRDGFLKKQFVSHDGKIVPNEYEILAEARKRVNRSLYGMRINDVIVDKRFVKYPIRFAVGTALAALVTIPLPWAFIGGGIAVSAAKSLSKVDKENFIKAEYEKLLNFYKEEARLFNDRAIGAPVIGAPVVGGGAPVVGGGAPVVGGGAPVVGGGAPVVGGGAPVVGGGAPVVGGGAPVVGGGAPVVGGGAPVVGGGATVVGGGAPVVGGGAPVVGGGAPVVGGGAPVVGGSGDSDTDKSDGKKDSKDPDSSIPDIDESTKKYFETIARAAKAIMDPKLDNATKITWFELYRTIKSCLTPEEEIKYKLWSVKNYGPDETVDMINALSEFEALMAKAATKGGK